jgi:hypothetical protein
MRFGQSTKRPCQDECRVLRHFLWWPITLDGQTRWLEVAEVMYRYFRNPDGDYWEPFSFVNP